MLGTHDLLIFVFAGLLLNMTPGVDTLYIVGRAARQGLRAGVVAALGISAGCTVHIVAAAAGISALLATSATAFLVVKYIGAAYLFYLGYKALTTKPAPVNAQTPLGVDTLASVFWQGALTNALNPKVALFFLAFLPQFIEPQAPAKWLSMLFLGALFTFNGTLWNIFVAASTNTLSRRLQTNPSISLWLNRMTGGLFVYFGFKLVSSEA